MQRLKEARQKEAEAKRALEEEEAKAKQAEAKRAAEAEERRKKEIAAKQAREAEEKAMKEVCGHCKDDALYNRCTLFLKRPVAEQGCELCHVRSLIMVMMWCRRKSAELKLKQKQGK